MPDARGASYGCLESKGQESGKVGKAGSGGGRWAQLEKPNGVYTLKGALAFPGWGWEELASQEPGEKFQGGWHGIIGMWRGRRWWGGIGWAVLGLAVST